MHYCVRNMIRYTCMPSLAMFPLYKSKPFIDKQLKLIVYVIIFMLFLKKFKPDILLLL